MITLKTFETKPVVLYNADKKELIGVFQNLSTAARYLNKTAFNSVRDTTRLWDCIRRKGATTIRKDYIFDFRIAARYASVLQAEELGDQIYIVKNNYPIMDANQLKVCKENI